MAVCQAPVAHSCNPSYSGGRDQEDRSLKSAQANSWRDPISKNTITKNWAGGVDQDEGPEFKPQYQKKWHLYKVIEVFFILCFFLVVLRVKLRASGIVDILYFHH
jgi:hypothetical protein